MATLTAKVWFTDGRTEAFAYDEPMALAMASPRLAQDVDAAKRGAQVTLVEMTWEPTPLYSTPQREQ